MFSTAVIVKALHDWAPAALAWERDNVGLILGEPSAPVNRILVCLDLTEEVAAEAVEMKCDCIVSHHPPIFKPVSSIRLDTEQGRIISLCLKNGISVIAMHTNADAAKFGVNYALAERLNLTGIRPLADAECGKEKVILFVKDGDDRGETFFRDLQELAATVSIGARFENGISRIEISTPVWSTRYVRTRASEVFGDRLITTHTVPLIDPVEGYGIGAVGVLREEIPAQEFLAFVKERLGCKGLRTTQAPSVTSIKTVAVCGGAGSQYIAKAAGAGADAFVTADIGYHTFQDYRNSLLVVDAGHYETERMFVEQCAKILGEAFEGMTNTVDIYISRIDTNPIRFV